MKNDPERLVLKGPAAVEQQLLAARPIVQKALKGAKNDHGRDELKHLLSSINRHLREIRRRKPRPVIYYEIDDLTDRERIMARIAKRISRGREVVYHGTRQLPAVLKTGKLIPPLWGERAVFFSRSAEVAAYFACLLGHASERRSPGILVLDKRSLGHCYRIEPNRYDQFSQRNEREEAIWDRVVNFRRHLIGVVTEAQAAAVLGPPKHTHLPPGFAHWPTAKRHKFQDRRHAAGFRLVKKGRARVRALIVKGREADANLCKAAGSKVKR